MTAFTFGAVGGISVNLLRWVIIANSQREERPVFDLLYWAQFAGTALLGGVLALAHDLSGPISALVSLNIGLSIPALAKAVAGDLLSPQRRTRR